MPKIKIKEWKGIYTNIDENDANLQVVRESINFRHDRGFLQFEPFALALGQVPTLSAGYEWETGIYCTLSNDPLAETPIPATYNILFLVAKLWNISTSMWDRKMYFRLNNIWEEIDSTYTDLPSANFNTAIDGRTFFKVDGGRLKIYMPHTAFWFGRLTRNFYGRHEWGTNYTINNFYLDKLIDGISVALQKSKVSFSIVNADGINIYANNRPVAATFIRTSLEGSNFWLNSYWELNIYNDDDQQKNFYDVYQFRYTDGDHELIPNPLEPDENNYHYFSSGNDEGNFTHIYIPVEYNALFTVNGDPLATVSGAPIDINVDGKFDSPWQDGFNHSPLHQYYRVPRASSGEAWFQYLTDHYACEWLSGGGTSNDLGFDSSITKFDMIITGVFDEREETILAYLKDNKTHSAKWAIGVTGLEPTYECSKRLTRLRVYVKIQDGIMNDYELVRDIEYLNPKVVDHSTFYIYPAVFTGVTLNDNIGFLVDEDRISEYQIKEGFRSIVSVDDVSFGVASTDYSNIYHSVIGGGNLMPNLLYSQNIYPLNNVSTINAMANINGRIGLFTDNTLYIIDIIDDAGALLFTIKSTLEFGVKNNDDVAEIQGGVAIHTMHGIYTTTGTQSNLISEPIDDIVKANFLTGSIKFNKYKHELLYKPSVNEDLYRFRFKDQVWEKLNKDYGT